jgi:hypothetical protein
MSVGLENVMVGIRPVRVGVIIFLFQNWFKGLTPLALHSRIFPNLIYCFSQPGPLIHDSIFFEDSRN